MTESVAATMDPDELQLARLVCGRFISRLQGLLSVGLSLAHSDGPAAHLFLRERFPDFEAHARVLHTIRGGMRPAMQSEYLHHQSQKVLEATQQFGKFISGEDGSWASPRPIPRQMRAAFLLLSDAVAEYARHVALDSSLIERMKSACLPIFDYPDSIPPFAEENAPCTSSTPTST